MRRVDAGVPPAAAALVVQLRTALQAAADPRRAPAMQAYMKSAMPFHGVPMPQVRRVATAVSASWPLEIEPHWRDAVQTLWRSAQYREERYAALHLAADRRTAAHQTLEAMTIYEEWIVTGAWWDFVDTIASGLVGPILARYPAPMRRRMLAWSRSPDLWKRRTAILCQLGFKSRTDPALLEACIEPSIESPEFFLRKAIGWALRQYARTDPAAVEHYVKRNRDRLSALSRREAMKHLPAS